MKTGKKILVTAFSATLVASLTSGLALTAFADEATKDYAYNGKYDQVYEDFDRSDISDTVTATGTGVDLGETPHLHVEFQAVTEETPTGEKVGQIYKNGSGSIASVSKGSITIRMRAPQSPVNLSDLYFGVRGAGNNSDDALVAKTFDQVVTGAKADSTVGTEWTNYTINFAQAYEDDDLYPMTETPVTDTNLEGIHIYAANGVSGVLDIDYISYGSNLYLTEFRGNTTDFGASAKYSDAGAYWADSRDGEIISRQPKLTNGGAMSVINGSVGKYKYAVIEAEGDVDGLKIATTEDGAAWGTAAAYDKVGRSVLLTGNEAGFKFVYEGSNADGVTVKRIYLTNNYVPESAYAVPVIDASTAKVLDDFSVDQTGFTGDDDMVGKPEVEAAGLYYRKSWNNGDKVTVADGQLVLDATDPATALIDFRFQSKSTFEGKYLVLKMAAKDSATLNDFRFCLLDENDATIGDVVYANDWKAGYNYKSALLNESNPYKDGDWYYVVIDIEESGLASRTGKYTGMLMYYSGTGKLCFDTIFFCNGIDVEIPASENIEQSVDCNTHEVVSEGAEDYAHEWLEVADEDGYGASLEFDLTPKDDDFDVSNLRLQIGDGFFWASENAQGTLKTPEGKTLNELTYVKDVPTHVVIDFEKSGISGTFGVIDVHMHQIKAFTITNIVLNKSVPFNKATDVDKEHFTLAAEEEDKSFTATVENGWQYAFSINVAEKVYNKLEFTLVPGEGFTGQDLRFLFIGDGTEYWLEQHDDVITADGKKYSELTFAEGVPVQFSIILEDIGVTKAFNEIGIHTTGTKTGSFELKNIKLMNYNAKDFITPVVNKYYPAKWAEQLALLPTYLDTVAPEVSITTATTATAGDEITVTYTASDNLTATENLNVTVSVTKDGAPVTLNGNKFTAQEGTYTVTVTVRDANGNEAQDTIQISVSANGNGGNNGNGDNGGGLSTGAIVGIVIGCVAAVAAIGAVIFVVLKKKKNN